MKLTSTKLVENNPRLGIKQTAKLHETNILIRRFY
jgi:hypothetical protein